MSGTLFVVATPIGNLEDVTARSLRVLREVALIAAEDTRRTSNLLARYGIQTPLTSLHEHNERSKTTRLISRLAAGESIAVVSDAGTPTISDPGGVLIEAAIEAGVRVEAVPGPSAILTLLAVAGLPTETFTFLGFPPAKANDRKSWVQQLRSAGRTVVFFEAPHRIQSTLGDISREYGECHIVVGRELTKAHEEVLRGPVSDVVRALGEPRGELCVAINLTSLAKEQPSSPPSDAEISQEFGYCTKSAGLTKRMAISAVARKLGLQPNQVYAALERAKNSV